MYNYKVVSYLKNSLGEGIYWDSETEALYWLDINDKKIYTSEKGVIKSWIIPEHASAILSIKNNSVTLASESGVVVFSLSNHTWDILSTLPKQYLSIEYRANDGIEINDGLYIYGVMKKEPKEGQGAIITNNAGLNSIICNDLAIPNTFIRLPYGNELLISDSLEQKIYKFSFNSDWSQVISRSVWGDFSETNMTPDGGCISHDGTTIYIAFWDGGRLIEFSTQGEIKKEHILPAIRPTNCVLSDDGNNLFVTSAAEGLDVLMLKKFPLSGCVFNIELNKI